MLTTVLAVGALCSQRVLAGSWPYTRTLPNGKTPADERNDEIPNLFVEWLRAAIEKSDDEGVGSSFEHGHVPKHVHDLDHLERHSLDNYANRSDLPKTVWDAIPEGVELTPAQEASALFDHLGFELEPECVKNKETYWYRTADGTCNWLKKGESYIGATGQPRSRDFKQTTYADGISLPREGPNAREVSNAFFRRKERLHYEHTPLMLGLVEFIMHDVSYTADSDTEFIDVPIPENDPAYNTSTHKKFRVRRSLPLPGSGTSKNNPREHVNSATAWLDASALYGSTPEVLEALRSHKDGKLKAQRGKDGFEYLPFNTQNMTVRTRPGIDPTSLFLGGDVRTNEDYIMLSVHTLLLREHNRLCDILVAQHPNWEDERIYQTIRLVLGAKMALIGNSYQMAYWAEDMPWPRDDGFPLYRAMYGESALSINPLHAYPWPLVTRDDRPMVTSAEMAIVYRFHEFIINKFPLKDAHNNTIEEREIFSTAFNATGFLEIGADPILRGMLATDIPNFKSGVDETFRSAGQYRGQPFDIVTWSVVHEREQGLPTFNQYFRGYANGVPKPELLVKVRKRFEDFSSDPKMVAELKRLYKTPDDVDLVVGVQLEEELFPGTTMPISALIPSLFSLFGVGNSDRFSPGFAVMRCLLVDKPWDCHPSNALEDLIWESRATEAFPNKRWFSEFWMKELDFQAHGTNLLWRLITENSGAKCIQKNPLFPFDPEKNPVLCDLPDESTNKPLYIGIGSALAVVLGGAFLWWKDRRDRRLQPGVRFPPINWGKPIIGVGAALQKDAKNFLTRQATIYGGKTFGLRLFGPLVYFIATSEDDVSVMCNDEPRASLVELTKDSQLGAIVGRHNFKQQLHATVIRRRLETDAPQTLPELAKAIEQVVGEWLDQHKDTLSANGGKVTDFRPLAVDLMARVMSFVCIGGHEDVYKNPELIQAYMALNKDSNVIFGIANLLPGWLSRRFADFKVRSHYATIRKHVLPVVQWRKSMYKPSAPPTSSLLDSFLNAADSDKDVSELVGGIVIGGLINLADGLTNALYNVAESKDDGLQGKLRARQPAERITPLKPDTTSSWNLLRSVTLESLRMAGCVIGPVRKIVVKGFRLGSDPALQLQRDSGLAASPLLMHYDENNYDKPHDFIPDRFAARDAQFGTHKFLTFGLPGHTCPGRFLAIEAISITLNALISRYEVEALAPPPLEPYTYSVGTIVMPRVPVPVRFTARS
jgi:cytochrome P450